MEALLAPFKYRRPRLALAAVITLVFILAMLGNEADHVQKFAFQLGTGAGLFFLVVSGKCIKNRYGNLGVLIFTCVLGMILASVYWTPAAVHTANGLESLAPPIIGGLGGMFTGVEDES